jgi:hypothetical protein
MGNIRIIIEHDATMYSRMIWRNAIARTFPRWVYTARTASDNDTVEMRGLFRRMRGKNDYKTTKRKTSCSV